MQKPRGSNRKNSVQISKLIMPKAIGIIATVYHRFESGSSSGTGMATLRIVEIPKVIPKLTAKPCEPTFSGGKVSDKYSAPPVSKTAAEAPYNIFPMNNTQKLMINCRAAPPNETKVASKMALLRPIWTI